MEKCGVGNTCHGSILSFQCVCTAKGYTSDPTDNSRCKEGTLFIYCCLSNISQDFVAHILLFLQLCFNIEIHQLKQGVFNNKINKNFHNKVKRNKIDHIQETAFRILGHDQIVLLKMKVWYLYRKYYATYN